MRLTKIGFLLLAFSISRGALAASHDFTTQFTHCSEFAGEGTVGLPEAQKLVPTNYTITGAAGGTAPVVIRMTHCAGIQVDATPRMPTTIPQIGINIVSPDGSGTINNYVVVYITDNPYLVKALLRAGAPARYDPTITYQYTRGPDGSAGELYGAVPGSGLPAYFLYGPETEPPPHSGQVFVANWWFGASSMVKEATTLPDISFGTSSVVFYTDKHSKLGKLIGGNAYGAFTILALRGEYSSGAMVVTVSGDR